MWNYFEFGLEVHNPFALKETKCSILALLYIVFGEAEPFWQLCLAKRNHFGNCDREPQFGVSSQGGNVV